MAGRAPRRQHRSLAVRAGGDGRFAVVAARFNEAISKKLLEGALAAFAGHGIARERVDVHWVPGSFELPQAAGALAAPGRYAAIVCVGVVIQGATPHFEYVSGAAAQGITHASLMTGVPMSFGVITALTEEQAWDRAGGAVSNRGEEAAHAAIEMAEFLRAIGDGREPARRPRRGRSRGGAR
jgi:6,7-dimethyl-8-ribityllumazine synthase